MEPAMSDNHAIEALNERVDNLTDIVDELSAEMYAEVRDMTDQIRELQTNVASIISMFTQMNISLLQIQNDVLGKEDK
jgi:TolA-binding protein